MIVDEGLFKKFQNLSQSTSEFYALTQVYHYIVDFQLEDQVAVAFKFSVKEVASSSPWVCTDYILELTDPHLMVGFKMLFRERNKLFWAGSLTPAGFRKGSYGCVVYLENEQRVEGVVKSTDFNCLNPKFANSNFKSGFLDLKDKKYDFSPHYQVVHSEADTVQSFPT